MKIVSVNRIIGKKGTKARPVMQWQIQGGWGVRRLTPPPPKVSGFFACQ